MINPMSGPIVVDMEPVDHKQEVYDAAMDWYNACQEAGDYDVGQTEDALDKLFVVCRQAKEGR